MSLFELATYYHWVSISVYTNQRRVRVISSSMEACATPHKEGSRRLPPTERGGWVEGWITVLGCWSTVAQLIEEIGPVEIE